MQTQFAQAIEQICEEKNIDKEIVMEAVEAALAAAYKKDYGEKDQEVRVNLNEESGGIEVFVTKEVVDEVENPNLEISISAASKLKKGIQVGETIEVMDLPADFGRIAAQTAKQVIVQRIREAERDMIFSEYKDKEGTILNCLVQRVEGDTVICDLGKASAVLYKNEQIPGERYYPNQRFRVFLVKVEQTARGPQIIVSRSHPGVVKKLFESEVPEIAAGIVEIMGVAREAGGRTKIAVKTTEEGVDPVGSFVGQRGIRVQSVMNEIGGEKIDIILYSEDPKIFIENALSPAKVSEINLEDADQKAKIKVPEDQLSLAIGKQGQNVRLAAKLTGWNIDIEGTGSAIEEIEGVASAPKKVTPKQDLEAAIIDAVKDQNTENQASQDKVAEEVPPVAENQEVVEESVEASSQEEAISESTESGEELPVYEEEVATIVTENNETPKIPETDQAEIPQEPESK
ncbi:transcription termination factor NusA [Patescibacteria group bacterium]|nr:transcription termination factor NusA [Patescibacteria group bacterium]